MFSYFSSYHLYLAFDKSKTCPDYRRYQFDYDYQLITESATANDMVETRSNRHAACRSSVGDWQDMVPYYSQSREASYSPSSTCWQHLLFYYQLFYTNSNTVDLAYFGSVDGRYL